MKWNLRWAAAKRDIWRPSDLLAAFAEVGFTPSLSKVAALWSGKPTTVRLDDLDKICAALDCTVADLLEAEPLAVSEDHERRAGGRSAARITRATVTPAWQSPPIAAAELTGGIREDEVADRAMPNLLGLG
ncbi:helix-turn-helix domain-containing protein [Mycobacterium riyadhense]|uniref:helix-turn-helix domain-containing protein n=1 Tax=Mycobacterium riyadhense TaxID=486698 RepID=UPI00195ACCA1|nr:helix-turn-helix transcriptional regulator [Mycobacterium riyadhense]